jgi:iron complex transport system substrate-binding protein
MGCPTVHSSEARHANRVRHTARGGDAVRKEVHWLVPRVVSLIASATEIVCALGCEDQLVGRSHECDYPPSIRHLPVCTEPLIDPSRPGAEIDHQIKTVLRQALSVYRVHDETLQALHPDVILTQAQCEVCAVSLQDVERSLAIWLASRPSVVSLEPNALADVWQDIGQVAEALGVPEQGTALVARLQERIATIAERVRTIPERPTVACIEWIDPLMAAGNWVPELVALAGGSNLFGEAGRHSPWMTWPELVARDPDVIIVMPCGFDIARSRADMPALTVRSEWSTLRAVQDGRVYLTDGNQYFNRPGPRLVESLEILAELLHPTAFCFGHEGTGWERAEEAVAWA